MIRPWTVGLAVGLLSAAPVHAQSASSSLSAFAHGFASGLSGLDAPVNVSTQEALGGTGFSGGVLQAPAGGLLANLSPLGGTEAAAGPAGLAQPGPTGGLPRTINVVSPKSAASASASSDLNGKVNLDGAP